MASQRVSEYGSVPTDSNALPGIRGTAVRHRFIQKVFGILGTQLVLTTIIASLLFRYADNLIKTSPGTIQFLLFASMAMSLGIMCVFMCSPNTMRSCPTNYILLLLFTIAESVMVGFICIQYTKESVLISLAITAFAVLALTLFSFQTSVDFTGFGPYLFCGMLCLMGLSFVFWIASMCGLSGSPAFQGLRLAYSVCGALLFSMYIVYDTQRIIGGKHKYQIGIDDYAMAAITLYLDIIQLFLFLLRIFVTPP